MLSRALARLVASLPEKARLVVIMRYQEDLDPSPDIAQVLVTCRKLSYGEEPSATIARAAARQTGPHGGGCDMSYLEGDLKSGAAARSSAHPDLAGARYQRG